MSDNCDMAGGLSRRRALAVAGGFAALAGCLGTGDDDDDDDGTDDPSDDGSADDTQNGSDEPNRDDTGNGDENGGDEPGELSLSALTLDGEDDSLEAFAETEIPIAVTAENVGGGDEFTLELIIEGDAPDGDPTVQATDPLELANGEQADVTFEDVTTELPEGTYDVTIAETDTADTRISGELVFTTPVVEITTNVYLKSADDDHRPEEGDVIVSRDGEVIDEKNIRINPSPTLEIPEGRGNTYTIEAKNIDGGIYPPIETTVTPTSYDPVELDFVTGYEFQTADSFNYTVMHMFNREETPNPAEDPGRGSLAETGDFFVEYNRFGVLSSDVDIGDTLQPFEEEISTLVQREYKFPTSRIGMKINDQRLYRDQNESTFSEDDEPFLFEVAEHGPPQLVREGLDVLFDEDSNEVEFLEQREYRDKTVDVYRVIFEKAGDWYSPEIADSYSSVDAGDYNGARVFVDPDTGYILRFESEMLPFVNIGPQFDAVEIWEFYDHNDVDELDTSWIDVDLFD